jgi:hypothetical protein
MKKVDFMKMKNGTKGEYFKTLEEITSIEKKIFSRKPYSLL